MNTPRSSLQSKLLREDLVAFLSAGLSATAQQEFYQGEAEQRAGITFLHDYICQIYPELYAETLALELNTFNTAQIIANLLQRGAPKDEARRKLEGALIARALDALPAPQAYGALMQLVSRRATNRRARAIAREFLATRQDLPLHVLKYRKQIKAIARHFHLALDAESQRVLFEPAHHKTPYETPLYETYRQAHYSKAAIYELPYTIAEGLISRHKIKRKDFLEKIAPQMTRRERERLQQSARAHRVDLSEALHQMELTRLCTMVLGMTREEREARREELFTGLRAAARRAATTWPYHANSIALILDNSFSATASRARKNRPLAVALALRFLCEQMTDSLRVFWTGHVPRGDDLLVTPTGQTSLAMPLLDALEDPPELILICSDGYENDPAGGVHEVWRLWNERVAPRRARPAPRLIHLNPVFDAQGFMPRPLTALAPTVSIHGAGDVPLALVIAEFASGAIDIARLEALIHDHAVCAVSAHERRAA